MDEDFLLGLHSMLLEDSPSHKESAGAYRSTPVLVRWEGKVVYVPPDPGEVHRMTKELFAELEGYNGSNAIQRSCMALLSLLKIHPFRDANGRSARWFATYMMLRGGHSLNPSWTLERYVDAHLEGYYAALRESTNENPWPWVRFYSEAIKKVFKPLRDPTRDRGSVKDTLKRVVLAFRGRQPAGT